MEENKRKQNKGKTKITEKKKNKAHTTNQGKRRKKDEKGGKRMKKKEKETKEKGAPYVVIYGVGAHPCAVLCVGVSSPFCCALWVLHPSVF